MHRLAFVVQRYGENVIGGSETFCRHIAERMSKFFEVEVLTTCALDYLTWKNELPAGATKLNGTVVRRFPNDFERKPEFSVLHSLYCRGVKLNHRQQEDWMICQGPYSSSLIRFIKNNRDYYDLFVFFTYLYCTTYYGIPLVSEKSVLIPTAHDEKPIYLDIFDRLFRLPGHFIFLTSEEREFVKKRFGLAVGDYPVIGGGIECRGFQDKTVDNIEVINEPYIIYAGRIENGKGCDLLFDYFIRFKDSCGVNLELFLIGGSHINIPDREDIRYLGFVSENEKWRLISGARALVMPSCNESFSLTVLEAMSCGVPVLVNGFSEVLKGHCLRSGGGIYFDDYNSFAAGLEELLADDKKRMSMGEKGRLYVRKNYDWELIEERYVSVFNGLIEVN